MAKIVIKKGSTQITQNLKAQKCAKFTDY